MEYPPLTGPGGGNPPSDPSMGAPAAPGQSGIDLMIQHAASQYNIPVEILRGLLMQESGGNANTRPGAAGEIGIAQFMPATAKALGIDASDPAQAIPGAALYLRQHLNRFGNDMPSALAAYNWGPGNVAKYGFAGAPASVKGYVSNILSRKGVPTPSGGGSGMGGSGGPGPGAPLGAPAQTTPLADAVTAQPPAQPQFNPAMLAQLGQAPSLGDIFSTTAQGWQQQMAKNAGLA